MNSSQGDNPAQETGISTESAELAAVDDSLRTLARALDKIILWKQRIFRVALACGTAVVICLSLLGWAVWDIHTANQRAATAVAELRLAEQQAHAAQLSDCENVGNVLRAREDGVWHKFVALATAGQKQSLRSEQIIRALLGYVDGSLAQVNCARIYGP